MFSLSIFCCLLAASSAFASEEKISDAEQRLLELFGNYDSHQESLVYERKKSQEESFSWRDCGGRGSLVRVKSFSISPLPLQLPGNVIVALNATVTLDIEPPVSVEMRIKKKIGLIWIDVCSHVPGGCKRPNICSTQPKPTAAAAVAEEADDYEEETQNPFCQMKKGDFNLPPTPFALTSKAPAGWYAVTALFQKGKKRVACMHVKLNIG